MVIQRLDQFKDGWFIGDFSPSLLRTKKFEVAVKYHKKDEHYAAHYQLKAVEYNVLIKGTMHINDQPVYAGDVFVIEPGEVAKPRFSSDCIVVCVKVPSIPLDKITVEE